MGMDLVDADEQWGDEREKGDGNQHEDDPHDVRVEEWRKPFEPLEFTHGDEQKASDNQSPFNRRKAVRS